MHKIFAPKDPAVSEMEREHAALVRQLAPQGMVLLENDGTLPLAGPERLALYGRGVRHTVRGGTGSGDVNARETVTVEEGFKKAGFTLTSGPWLDALDRELAAAEKVHEEELAAAMKAGGKSPIIIYFEHPFVAPPEPVIPAETGDLAVYVISRNSGEGKDRSAEPGDYYLSGREEENLRTLRKSYRRLVVVLNVGGVMDTAFLRDLKPNALLHMSQAGAGGGDALADALLGLTPPSGRLTDTWALGYGDYPSSATFGKNDGDLDREPYGEDIFVGYRYFDTFGKEVAYPFGYGLDYTDFRLTCAGAEADKRGLRIRAKVENVGSRPGRFVAQAYATPPAGHLAKPLQTLIAYGKTRLLQPGESQELELTCTLRELASFCEKKSAWVLEPGEYILRLGRHSRDSHVAAVLRLDDLAVLETVGRFMKPEEELKLLRPDERTKPIRFPGEEAEKAAAPVLELKAGDIPCIRRAWVKPILPRPRKEAVTLEDVSLGRRTALEWAVQQTDEALAGLVVGAGGNQSMVGSASVHVPGAAGETGSHIPGVPPMILADGPAGLRLTPHFQLLKNGKILQLENRFAALMGEDPEKEDTTGAEDYYQYATAIPIATLLAQSWDTELVKACGRLVGKEMEKFGVTLWLAPGMNIHRNPLCGRNFEYYAEDPLVAGYTAAAMTLGVQETPGVGTTPKHYACNSQEDNRAYENSLVSTRALREIYLRGFELCVRLSQPMSLMTSYNCINGTHSANHWDLLNGVLRRDWGFKGFVMTDWGTTGNSGMEMAEGEDSVPALCIRAGNDLIMPGNPADIRDILDSLAGKTDHPLSREDLVLCAARIFAVLAGSNLAPAPIRWSGRYVG